jgi:xanthine dehydrogenase small subunit
MRDHVLFYLNGRRIEVRGAAAFASLTDYLRQHCELTGTKVVCSEGDCGACTVLVGEPVEGGLRYLTVDACIQFLYQIDGRHIVTIEGLTPRKPVAELHPIQQAMVDCHGSQCGFCTPGFVMAIAGRTALRTASEAAKPESTSLAEWRTALTGNLCRCTGYVAILDAALAIDKNSGPSLAELYPEADIGRSLLEATATPLHLETLTHVFSAPHSLDAALAFRQKHPRASIVSGGTELGVQRNKAGFDPAARLSLTRIPELHAIAPTDNGVAIGANVTWTQIENWSRAALPEFYRLVIRFGSPQIRNVGTLAGNVANGSPIADSLPLLLVMDAELDIASVAGTRRVKMVDFYKGYKVKDLADDELITHIRIPTIGADDTLKLYKVSRRTDLDIATFGAALRVRRAGELITRAYIAYSGVAATVIRLPRTETFLQGKRFTAETFAQAGAIARSEIEPITDVRGSRDFRWTLAENIVSKFYVDCVDAPSEATP